VDFLLVLIELFFARCYGWCSERFFCCDIALQFCGTALTFLTALIC